MSCRRRRGMPGFSDQLGDAGRVGLDRLGGATPAGGVQRRDPRRGRREEVVTFDHGLQRVPEQWIPLAEELEQACPACRRGEDLGDVDEQPAAGDAHRPRGRELPHGEPEGLHRVGHHLLVADGDVHVVRLVAGRRDGEQRGDRPALDDVEIIVDEAPLDVLRAAEVRLDPPAQPRELHHLRIGEGGLLLVLGSIASSRVPPPGTAWMATCLAAIVRSTTLPSRTL